MNIIFLIFSLIRFVVFGIATGMVFIRLNLFGKMIQIEVLLIGLCSTPMFLSLFDYILGFVFVGCSSWIFFFVPIVFSAAVLSVKKNYICLVDIFKKAYKYCFAAVKESGKWVLFDILTALAIIAVFIRCFNGKNIGHWPEIVFVAVTLLLLCIELAKKGKSVSNNLFLIIALVVLGSIFAYGIQMHSRPIVDSDRSHYELNARYFSEDKNSSEIDNYSDEKYGSSFQDDHGPLWVLYLADAHIVAGLTANNDVLLYSNLYIFLVYLCFLGLLSIIAAYVAGTYKASVAAIMLFHIYYYTNLMVFGSRDAFRFVGLFLLVIYLCNTFDRVKDGKMKWYEYAAPAQFCYLSMNGHEGNVYIMLGLFLTLGLLFIVKRASIKHLLVFASSVLVGTVLGVTKTISIYLRTGKIATSTSMVFHDTPVEAQIIEKANRGTDFSTVMSTYTFSVKLVVALGAIGLFVMFLNAVKSKNEKELLFSVLVIGMLIPLTGAMDWIGYKVSLWFFEQLRYRMYFLGLLSMTGGWLLTRQFDKRVFTCVLYVLVACFTVFFLQTEKERCTEGGRAYLESCIKIRNEYVKLADNVSKLTDKYVLTRDQVIAYYLINNPKLLYHPYSEDLIQAKSDAEIKRAIDNLNVGAILLPENGIDYHNYSLLPFWNYINDDEKFKKVIPEERTDETKVVIFYSDEE